MTATAFFSGVHDLVSGRLAEFVPCLESVVDCCYLRLLERWHWKKEHPDTL